MSVEAPRHRLTRRQLLAGGAGGAVALAGAGYGVSRLLGGDGHKAPPGSQIGTHDYVRAFHSRPDLHPAPVHVSSASFAPGYLFLGLGTAKGSVAGPQIVDRHGEPVWYKPISTRFWATNVTTGSYRGRPVLSWWEGQVLEPLGYGKGEAVIVDSSYREIARVRAANGRQMDLHEFRLTPQGTALFMCYPEIVDADLSALGGSKQGKVLGCVMQEVDVSSGRLRMEWKSLDHIPLSESYRKPADPYDYLHLNSIDVAPDGNLLVSGRHSWSLYKVDRHSGEVIWRLGGKRTDFTMGNGAQYAWQHHGRMLDDRTVTVFDNGADGKTNSHSKSRGVFLDVDATARRVRLKAAYTHPKPLLAVAMGSVELLPGGHVVVGWGIEPAASEFAADGTLLSDALMPVGQKSYRASRRPWSATPHDAPVIAARRDDTKTTLYVSWNGATDVTHWQVHAGASPGHLRGAGVARRSGFETAIALHPGHRYAAVAALDHSGRALGKSTPIRL